MTASYDELVTGTGSFRPHWRALMEIWSSLAPEQLSDRFSRVSAQIANANQILTLPERIGGSSDRSLDLLPLIIPEREWRGIATGLIQRARLLNAILEDLYGPQRLLAEHKLPPYLVLGNPAFLRPLRSLMPPSGAPHLYSYAADLTRLPNGEWRVFSDRTQAPGGFGYALLNRGVLARAMPEVFRAAPVSQLQNFLELWQTSLRGIGMKLGEAPLIVLFTPGPYNDAYFEHVFLARELGITLVQSADLTVRDNHVFLKTLAGLSRVDVIYRRVDGDYCDSLELREDSALGVAGLVEVARAGHVAILNMPGAAVVEAPAFAPFLPELARELLGEELELPAITTWWCGQESARAEVQASLDSFVLHSAFDPDPVPIDPALLSAEDRANFAAQLARHPERFVAREKIPPSVAPCFSIDDAQNAGGRLVPKSVVLRVMALWHSGAWFAMPGGVASVVSDQPIYRGTLRHGAVLKDVWVLADDGSDNAAAALAAAAPMIGRTESLALRSRTADDLFWLGRQVERLDAGARLFLATLHRLTAGTMGPRQFAELLRLTEALKRTGWINFTLAAAPVDGRMFFDGIIRAAGNGASMRNSIDAINRLMHAARDQLSIYMWQILQRLTTAWNPRFDRSHRGVDKLLESLDVIVASLAAFGGLVAENMTRGAGWRFLDLGRRIERVIVSCQSLGGVMTGPPTQMEAGLRLALVLSDTTSAYWQQYPLETHFTRALSFVLVDRLNPRSLRYQLDRVERHLNTQAASVGTAVDASGIQSLSAAIAQSSFDIVDTDSMIAQLGELFRLLDRAVGESTSLSDAITRAYFTHTATPHLMGFSSRNILARAET